VNLAVVSVVIVRWPLDGHQHSEIVRGSLTGVHVWVVPGAVTGDEGTMVATNDDDRVVVN
jgi:hypothetical protein